MDTFLLVIVLLIVIYFLFTIYNSIKFIQMCDYANIDLVFDVELNSSDKKVNKIIINKYREKSLLLLYLLKRFTEKYFDNKANDSIEEMMHAIRGSQKIPLFDTLKINVYDSNEKGKLMNKEAKKLLKEWNQYIKMSQIAIKVVSRN